jgi:hypothetical protein
MRLEVAMSKDDWMTYCGQLFRNHNGLFELLTSYEAIATQGTEEVVFELVFRFARSDWMHGDAHASDCRTQHWTNLVFATWVRLFPYGEKDTLWFCKEALLLLVGHALPHFRAA